MKWLKTKAATFIKNSLGNVYRDSTFFGSFGLSQKFAGVEVNYTTAMQQADVYTCVRIKAEALGQLPVKLYRFDNNGVRRQITKGREHTIFTIRPNAYQTWQEFIETYVSVMEIQGNFYAEIKRNRYGNVYELIPFKYQNNIRPNMDQNGVVYYVYATNDGKGKVTKATYNQKDILHIKMNNTNGYEGMSPITQAAKDIGMAIAGTRSANSLFENGNMPVGVLTTDEVFGDDDNSIERLRKDWNDQHGGPDNRGKTAILENGLTYQTIQMSSVDAQLLEMMGLSREKIASLFRVPSHMLNAKDGMKYNTVEHNNTGFFRDSLMPLATKLENNIKELLPENHIIKLDEKAFVRGDRQTQVETIESEIKSGLCSLNEGRIELGREPLEGGDVYAIQTNNLTFGTYEDIARMRELNIQRMEREAAPNPANSDEPENTPQEQET